MQSSMQSSTSLPVSSVASPVGPLLLDREQAFESFYAEHVAFVWRNLKRLGIPCAELEDVCQEVFVTVHRRWESFEARATPRSWLYGIVRRVAWRHRRGSQRRERRHAAFDVSRRYQTGEPAVASRVLAVRLQQFLEQLDDDKRDVFVLAELEELTAREIAERVGVGPNTVYSRLRAARAAFELKFGPLPRQRDAVRRLHAGDEPDEEQRNRMWLVIVGTPIGAVPGSGTAWKAVGTKVGIPVAVAAIVTVVTVLLLGSAGKGPTTDNSPPTSSEPTASVVEPAAVLAVVPTSVPARVPDLVPESASGTETVSVSEPESEAETETVTVTVTVSETGSTAAVTRTTQSKPRTDPIPIPPPEPAPSTVADPADPSPAPTPQPIDADPPAPTPETTPKPTARTTSTTRDEPAESNRIQLARPNRGNPETPDVSGQLDPAELTLLQAARQALDAGSPRRALAKIREHARRFGDSSLAPERNATAAEAHCALGHERKARPYLRRLERSGHTRLAKSIRERCD